MPVGDEIAEDADRPRHYIRRSPEYFALRTCASRVIAGLSLDRKCQQPDQHAVSERVAANKRERSVQDRFHSQRNPQKIDQQRKEKRERRDEHLSLCAGQEALVLARRKKQEIHQAEREDASSKWEVGESKQPVKADRCGGDKAKREHHFVPHVPGSSQDSDREPDQARKEKTMFVMLAEELGESEGAAII